MYNILSNNSDSKKSFIPNLSYTISKTSVTPFVKLSYDEHFLLLRGDSCLERPKLFYTKIDKILDNYMQSGNDELKVHLRFTFINPPTVKHLHGMMQRLQLMRPLVRNIHISWYYNQSNELMREYGQYFQHSFPDQINLIAQ